MKTTLVAIGCSHTSGSELHNGKSECFENRQLTYAKTVADNLNFDYINLAVNGGSNDYIFRSTIQFINDNFKKIHQYRFLIGWTSSLRTELRMYEKDKKMFYRYDDLDFYDKNYVQITSKMDPKLIEDYKMKSLISKYRVVLLEDDYCSDKFANYAFSLQSIFNSCNIKYYMFNTIHGQIKTKNNKNTIKQLNLNPRYYKPTDHEDTFFFHCKDKLGFNDITKYWHHKQEAHDAWAQILYERCKKWLS